MKVSGRYGLGEVAAVSASVCPSWYRGGWGGARRTSGFAFPLLLSLDMHLHDLYTHSLGKPGAWEDTPFGPDVLVLKVRTKMFAMVNVAREPHSVALKSDPERWVDLKERFDGITRGPYLDGKHWNSVGLHADVPEALIRELVDRSYALVVAGLTRKERGALDEETGANASGGPA